MAHLLKRDKRSTAAKEWGILNYLNKHSIYKDNKPMQLNILNSFVFDSGVYDETSDWKDRIAYIQNHFGKFCMYAHNNWKNAKT